MKPNLRNMKGNSIKGTQGVKITQRTKNRIREHADHSWGVIRTDPKLGQLFDCTCGWIGWLPIEEVKQATELGLM